MSGSNSSGVVARTESTRQTKWTRLSPAITGTSPSAAAAGNRRCEFVLVATAVPAAVAEGQQGGENVRQGQRKFRLLGEQFRQGGRAHVDGAAVAALMVADAAPVQVHRIGAVVPRVVMKCQTNRLGERGAEFFGSTL